MHLYLKDNALLEKEIKRFQQAGAPQIQLETSFGDVYRGLVERCSVDLNTPKATFWFSWLCRVYVSTDRHDMLRMKGIELPSYSNTCRSMELKFTSYYFQPSKKRIKFWTYAGGEVVRIFWFDDPTNLVRSVESVDYVGCTLREYKKLLTLPKAFQSFSS